MDAQLVIRVLRDAANTIESAMLAGVDTEAKADAVPLKTTGKRGKKEPAAPAASILDPNTPAPSWTDPNLDPAAGQQSLPFAAPATPAAPALPAAPAAAQLPTPGLSFQPPAAPKPVVQFTLDDVLMLAKKFKARWNEGELQKLEAHIATQGYTLATATPAQLKDVAEYFIRHI